MAHPAMKRAWLQTGGLEVSPVHADLRAEFDRTHDVEYIGGACFKLFDAKGVQVGIMQFQADAQARVDAAVMATTERLATGGAKPINIAAGDTVVRSLNMNDPTDVALMQNALNNAESNVIVPDIERQDPPPINLPDYDRAPEDHAAWLYPEPREAERIGPVGWIILALVVILCGILFFAMHFGGMANA